MPLLRTFKYSTCTDRKESFVNSPAQPPPAAQLYCTHTHTKRERKRSCTVLQSHDGTFLYMYHRYDRHVLQHLQRVPKPSQGGQARPNSNQTVHSCYYFLFSKGKPGTKLTDCLLVLLIFSLSLSLSLWNQKVREERNTSWNSPNQARRRGGATTLYIFFRIDFHLSCGLAHIDSVPWPKF
jgi:hypothetical protein